MKRPRMLVAMPLAQPTMERLADAGDVTVMDPGEAGEDSFQEALASHDGVLCSAMQGIPDECLERASDRLRVVSNFGVGYDNINVALATRLGVRVCNTPGILSDAVAELVMLLILALARRLDDASGFVRRGDWGTASFPLAHDISGKTLGLVGFGRIGRAVAERALAFNMRVVASDVRDIAEGPWEQVSFATLLAEADFVSVHVNLSQATRGLIGDESLTRMKRSAYLVNTSRGPVVDTAALRQALISGAIAGAALDVTDPEPPAPDDPLLSMPQVIVTPHVGTGTVETREKMGDLAATNLIDSLAGRQPPAVVNQVDLQLTGAA